MYFSLIQIECLNIEWRKIYKLEVMKFTTFESPTTTRQNVAILIISVPADVLNISL